MMTLQLQFQLMKRGGNRTELDLGCREGVEVRECFSLPEILELRAQCELARYRGAALKGAQDRETSAGKVSYAKLDN